MAVNIEAGGMSFHSQDLITWQRQDDLNKLNHPPMVQALSQTDLQGMGWPSIVENQEGSSCIANVRYGVSGPDKMTFTLLGSGCLVDASAFLDKVLAFNNKSITDQNERRQALLDLGAVEKNGGWFFGLTNSGESKNEFDLPIIAPWDHTLTITLSDGSVLSIPADDSTENDVVSFVTASALSANSPLPESLPSLPAATSVPTETQAADSQAFLPPTVIVAPTQIQEKNITGINTSPEKTNPETDDDFDLVCYGAIFLTLTLLGSAYAATRETKSVIAARKSRPVEQRTGPVFDEQYMPDLSAYNGGGGRINTAAPSNSGRSAPSNSSHSSVLGDLNEIRPREVLGALEYHRDQGNMVDGDRALGLIKISGQNIARMTQEAIDHVPNYDDASSIGEVITRGGTHIAELREIARDRGIQETLDSLAKDLTSNTSGRLGKGGSSKSK